jgi:hypothetical protein
VDGRQKYVVGDGDGAADAALVCGAIFDVLAPIVATAVVDAYSDFTDQMPDDIRAAEQWLRGRGFARGTGDPGVGITVQPADDVSWTIVRAYAPWSVQIALFDASGAALAAIHDGGRSVMLDVCDEDALLLALAFGDSASLVPLSQWKPPDDRDRDGGGGGGGGGDDGTRSGLRVKEVLRFHGFASGRPQDG